MGIGLEGNKMPPGRHFKPDESPQAKADRETKSRAGEGSHFVIGMQLRGAVGSQAQS